MSLSVGMPFGEECGFVDVKISKSLDKVFSKGGASTTVVGRLNIDYLKPLAVGSKMIR
jgi:hypothetical protein